MKIRPWLLPVIMGLTVVNLIILLVLEITTPKKSKVQRSQTEMSTNR
jgi:hypothetical protein